MDSGISINGAVKIENLEELGRAILDIATCSASDQVKERALEALYTVAKVEHVTISGCHIEGGKNFTFE